MTFLDVIKAIVFGIVEGITEWLPISSTGHMLILEEIMPLHVSAAFLEMFLVVIQLGAVMAVVVLYWRKLWPIRRSKRGNGFVVSRKHLRLWGKIIIACIPAGLIGVLWGDLFDSLFYHYQSVAVALALVGVLFIVVENHNKDLLPTMNTTSEITWQAAFIIGLFQVLAAVFPGVSRSGATILGAIFIGVSRKAATEFTFYLAIPVMFGASLLKVIKLGFAFTGAESVTLIIGMLVAFFVSVIAIRFLVGYVKRHDFKFFGIYRIVLGVLVILISLLAK